MAVTLNASTSAGLVQTADTSGVLALQTAGTTAVSISSGQVVTLTNALAEASGGTGTIVGYNGFKNRIINSAMVIDQRNAGASFTPTDQSYSLDRWKCRLSQASKYTVQQNAGSVTPPAGFKNYLGVTSSSAYSIGASDYFAITQIIEGYNVADLDYGTANAATITFSFWVRSSLTGTFGGALMNSAENRSYPFTYTINSANTWEKETITIAGDTSGTWLTTNGIGLYVVFGIGVGSTYSGTAGAWAASSTILSATGATSVVGTNGATFYVTGVQLEKGSTATSFDYRPYGTELALCQRYGYRIPFTGTSIGILFQAQGSGTAIAFPQHPVTMRSAPSGTFSSGWTYSINGSDTSGTISLSGSDTFTCQIEFSTSGLTAGQAGRLRSGSAFISAEL